MGHSSLSLSIGCCRRKPHDTHLFPKTKCSDHHHHLPSFHPYPGVPFLTSAQQASHDFPAFPTPSILHYHQLQGHQTFPLPPPSLSVSAKSHSYTCTYSCKRCYILTTMVGVRVCVWVILWVAAVKHGDGVTVSAPAPSLDCSSAFLELTDCLTFVENGSTVAKPAGKCCSGLKKVVKKEVSCLCDVFKQGASLGVNITKALTLPSACGVSTPPFSKCNTDIAGVPAAAPVPSPSPGAPSSVSTGAPSPLPGKSSAVSLLPGPCFRLLGSMGVTLWLHHQFQGL